MLYKLKAPYKHLTQMVSCCGPTSFQMVLFRHGIWTEQEQLAYDMGLIIRDVNSDYYTLPFKEAPEGDPMLGLKIHSFESKNTINILKGFGFKSNIFYYSDLDNFEKLIIESILQDRDIMINFKREGMKHNLNTGGHFALVSSYDSEKRVVNICDPTTRAHNYWEIGIDELKESMSDKRDDRERGIVIIEKI